MSTYWRIGRSDFLLAAIRLSLPALAAFNKKSNNHLNHLWPTLAMLSTHGLLRKTTQLLVPALEVVSASTASEGTKGAVLRLVKEQTFGYMQGFL